MTPTLLHFTLERETKGTFVFAEVSELKTIGSLYIRKDSPLGKAKPTYLAVSLSPATEPMKGTL